MDRNNRLHGEDHELAPEIEWLLHSHHFTAAQVAQGLVRTCFPDLYRWMVLCLGDREAASAAAVATILAAAENAYRYTGQPAALAWVFRLGAQEITRLWQKERLQKLSRLLKPASPDPDVPSESHLDAAIWQEVDRLPPAQRLALNLAYGLGWPAGRIGPVLQVSEQQAASLIAQAYERLLPAAQDAGMQTASTEPAGLPESLSACLDRRQAAFSGDMPDLPVLARQVGQALNHRALRQSRRLRWKETLWLAGTAGLIAGVLWAANAWLPEPDSPPVLPGPGRTLGAAENDLSPARTPPAPTPGGLVAYYHVQPGDTLAGIARFLGVPLDELRRLNPQQLNDAIYPGQTLRVHLRRPENLPLPTPVLPGETPEPFSPPNRFPDNFLQWVVYASARWTTIWMDGVYLDYGPPEVVRPPEQTPFQAWYSKPNRDLLIWRAPGQDLSRVLSLGEWQYASHAQGQIDIYQLQDMPGTFGDSLLDPVGENFSRLVSSWLPPTSLFGRIDPRSLVYASRMDTFRQPGEWRLLDQDQFAGRSVVIAEWHRHTGSPTHAAALDPAQVTLRRLWIDAATGVILRWQELAGSPDEPVLAHELVVTSLQYDQDFTRPDLFSPWALDEQAFLGRNSGWLADPDSLRSLLAQSPPGRERLEKVPPPPGFDPAAALLKFQYPPVSRPVHTLGPVEVFAGRYYLGEIELSDPESMLCVRSANGRQIAYTYDPFGNPDIMGIAWFRLDYPLRLNRIEIPLIPDSLAFSPDGRYLAYYASPLYASLGSLNLLDTQTGRQRRLAGLVFAGSLAWSPDGRSLAMIVADPEPEMREARILDIETGLFSHRYQVSIKSLLNPELRGPDWPSPEWPGHAWELAFPPDEPGWRGCL